VVVDRVEVETEREGVVTRRQVSADGRSIEEAPVRDPAPAPAPRRPATSAAGGFFVQVGAFSVEANARALQQRLVELGQDAWVDEGDLFRVRIGPFRTREEAAARRSILESRGISALIVAD
jgi:cell division protein FtsN